MKEPTPIKILIADDETLARKRIETFLEETSFPIILLQASNGKQTIDKILNDTPDLVFLDIKMTDMTGFDVLQQLPKESIPEIIFVTAFDTFAVQAFEVQALDFLLKPYKKARFLEALERGMLRVQQSQEHSFSEKVEELMKYISGNKPELGDTPAGYLDKIVLKSNKKYIFVATENVQYIKASGYYAEIFTHKGEKHLYRISMTELSQKLDPTSFSRVNRSAIVNRNFVKEVISEGLGDFSIVMTDQTAFPLSKTHKSTFLKQMGIRS
ncbi:LytTR family DNA-binding domain-containing protein [Aureisphaera galaxeae]|uniref:LytR/AlgR family response regulator transcription factor n=1 Tax=Aureisphaera galaxeae TaxID=1538023 RepID=UPI00234FDA03|nr:LytTR family DNA-binding domain-containing protein [Aureisphaera galaxeae]MDC8002852.1 LytTR family DNA-binding domain-containing protein [Aureisphaera galaxeae]